MQINEGDEVQMMRKCTIPMRVGTRTPVLVIASETVLFLQRSSSTLATGAGLEATTNVPDRDPATAKN